MDNNREQKTVRFDLEPRVIFVDVENKRERVPGPSVLHRRRVEENQTDLLRRSSVRQQPGPPALPPKNHTTKVMALIHEILEKPLDPSPPSTPSAVIPSSSSSSPPPLLPKQQQLPKPKLPPKPKVLPKRQPRAMNSLSVTSRGTQRCKRHLLIPLNMYPPVPTMMAPPLPPRLQPQPSTSNADAVIEVAPTVVDRGQDAHGNPRTTECQTEIAGQPESKKGVDGNVKKHKGRCKKRNGSCKMCDRAVNRTQGDGNNSNGGDDDEKDNGQGCWTQCLLITVRCMECSIS